MPHPIGLFTRPQAAAGGTTVLASDSFNRVDGALSGSSTDSYAGGSAKTWGNLDGNFQIVSNVVTSADSNNGKQISIDIGQSTMSVSCDVTQTGNFQVVGIMAQWVNAGEFYLARMDHSADVFELYKRVGFTYTSLGSTSAGGLTSATIVLVCTSASQVMKVNGTTVLTATDTAVGAGTGVGFWSKGTSHSWDNLIVSSA